MALTIVLALLAAVANAISSILQRVANQREAADEQRGVRAITQLFRQPVWLSGIGALIAGFLLQASALSQGQIATVQPLLALELAVTLVLASRVFHRGLRRRDWLAVFSMAVGMAVLLFSLHPTAGDASSIDALAWIIGGGVTGALVVALVLAGVFSSGGRRGGLFGIAAGVSFALTALFMSAALSRGLSWDIFTRWPVYLMVATGITATVVLQFGMQAATLVAVQPGVTLADPAVSIVLGVVLLHEQVRSGWWIAPSILGAVVIGWGTFTLSRSAASSTEGGDQPNGPDPDNGSGPPARTGHESDEPGGPARCG